MFCEPFALFPGLAVDGEVGVMAYDTALVFESLAEALRAKELIDLTGKPKYWVTFIHRLEHYDDGIAARQAPGRWTANALKGLNGA